MVVCLSPQHDRLLIVGSSCVCVCRRRHVQSPQEERAAAAVLAEACTRGPREIRTLQAGVQTEDEREIPQEESSHPAESAL